MSEDTAVVACPRKPTFPKMTPPHSPLGCC